MLAARDGELAAIEADLAHWYTHGPFADAVARLAAYRGVAYLGALTIASEVGDWRRFPAARTFMGFTGWSRLNIPPVSASTVDTSPRPATPTYAPNRNIVTVAIAREPAGFPWADMTATPS